MSIDWFTVIAEIVNFLILIWLLKYFLYDRILAVADERTEKIAARFEEAEEKERRAEEEAEKQRRARRELDEQREALLAEAREEAEARHRSLIDEARQAVEKQKEAWQQTLAREKETFLQELRRRAGQETYALARRVLADLADAQLERRILEVFIDRLRQLDDQQRQTIVETLREEAERLEIYSAFEIPEEQRQALRRTVQNQFGEAVDSRFKQNSDLLCGIELRANGHKVAWSVDSYLATLEERLSETLRAEINGSSQEQEQEKQKQKQKQKQTEEEAGEARHG